MSRRASGREPLVLEPGYTEDICNGSAEKRLFSFFQDIGDSCHDPQRQSPVIAAVAAAIPKLLDAPLVESCDNGCPFHVIISEAGGKAVKMVAFSAFLRAFIASQPQTSVLYIWSCPGTE